MVVLSGSMGKSFMMVCKKRKKLQLIGQLITILTACTIPKCEGKPLRISSCFFRSAFGVGSKHFLIFYLHANWRYSHEIVSSKVMIIANDTPKSTFSFDFNDTY